MENDILSPKHAEASGANLRMKINMIKNNTRKYSVSTICQVLQVSRSTYYYKAKPKQNENYLVDTIVEIFHQCYNNYVTKKIKQELKN